MQTIEMTSAHWDEVRQVYVEGLRTGQATFEIAAPSWEVWDQRHLPFARLVAAAEGAVAGWAALSAVSTRSVYAGVAEVSVYVREGLRGQGVGLILLQTLITESEKNDIWTLQASIFPENQSSIRLHQRCGFRTVGIRERIGRLAGIWRDTMLLERRSPTIGIPG